jgi:hypothetical protein
MKKNLPMCPVCHAQQERKNIRSKSFRCTGCGEYLSISHDGEELRWWVGVGLSTVILLIIRPNPWLAALVIFPLSLATAIVLSLALVHFHPPKLERWVPPGTLGLRDDPKHVYKE